MSEPQRPRLVAPAPISQALERIEARLAAGDRSLFVPPCTPHGVDDCLECERAKEAAEEEIWLARDRTQALLTTGVPERYTANFQHWHKNLPEAWEGDPWAVVIVGKPGSGKTHHAAELLWRWLRPRHTSAVFVRAALIPRLAFADRDHPDDRAAYQRLLRAPMAAIDDLGRGYSGAVPVQAIGEVVAERYDRLLPTVFTTNAATEDHLGDPALADRLRDSITVEFKNDSRRGPK